MASCHKEAEHHLTPKDWSTLSISLSKSWSQLHGPVYGFTVHGDGKLEYEGLAAVPAMGRHSGKVQREVIVSLLQEFEKADFMSLDNRFQADHGNVVVSLSVDGKTKTVIAAVSTEDAPDPPADRLPNLENRKAWMAYLHLPRKIVTKLGIERWTECSNACMQAIELRDMHVMVGRGAVLDAIQGKIPGSLTTVGIDPYALIEAGFNVNYSDRQGTTPLMAAAEKGDARLVRNLLECGADATAKDKKGRTAVEYTVSSDVLAAFKLPMPGR